MAGGDPVLWHQQVDRILASPGFARNERLSRFLRFVVERHLEGREADLKESVIGVEVFGRRPDYYPKRDAVVRVEAGRLRARLTEYYATTGSRDAAIIELPKGGYVPTIHPADQPLPKPAPDSFWRLKRPVPVLALLAVVLIIPGLVMLRSSRRAGGPPGLAGNGQRLRSYETSPAYDLYLRARTAYHPGRELADLDVDIYQEMIRKDPMFAPAYAGLAAAYAFACSRPIGEPRDGLVKMRAAAERAIQLNPLLPEGHAAMGVVNARLGKWIQAEQSFDRAIELAPKAVEARLDLVAIVLVPLGWISNALQQMRAAEKADPFSPDVQDAYAYVLITAGQFDRAEPHCRKSANSPECLGRIRIAQGRMDEAVQILAEAPNSRFLGYAYGRGGRREEAQQLAAISPGALQQVLIYAGLGDKDRTLQALDRMADLGPVRVGRTLTLPELAFLRRDPRLNALRRKVGLPEQ
jgi:tetratricopeptide (TPR) repeat protein